MIGRKNKILIMREQEGLNGGFYLVALSPFAGLELSPSRRCGVIEVHLIWQNRLRILPDFLIENKCGSNQAWLR